MATFRPYVCEQCGYHVETEETGHYGLMSGVYYNFKCPKCKDIISLPADELASYRIECNRCGNDENLSTWNPIEGKCPKCGGNMKLESDMVIMAD